MSLFTPDEMVLIRKEIESKSENILVTFKSNHGPTKLKELWISLLEELGHSTDCLHWWSSSGTLGLLECDIPNGKSFYGQWALSDDTKLIGVFEISDEDLVDIREGYDAGNVVSPEMRAIRIGETGDKD